MNAAVLSPCPATAAKAPAAPSAAAAWDEICRGLGIAPLSEEEAASLPPWTEKEASAFERAITEAFEQVDTPAASQP